MNALNLLEINVDTINISFVLVLLFSLPLSTVDEKV